MTATYSFLLILAIHSPASLVGKTPESAETRLVLDHGLTLPDCLALYGATDPHLTALPNGVTVSQLPACEVEPGT